MKCLTDFISIFNIVIATCSLKYNDSIDIRRNDKYPHKTNVVRLYPPPPQGVPRTSLFCSAYRVKFYWRTKYYVSGF